MSPPPGMPPAGAFSFSGFSATMASLVRNRPALEAASCRADLDHRDAAAELRQTLLELLAVVVRVGLLDLSLDLVDPTLDVLVLAATLDDRRVVLRDDDLAGRSQQIHGGVLELQADLLGDDLSTREDRDVLEHGLAPIPEAGGLDGRARERAADAVDDERREGLTLDVLGDHDQRLARLH